MITSLHRLIQSPKIINFFNFVFDVALVVAIIRLVIVIPLEIFLGLFDGASILYTLADQSDAISYSLNTIILVEIYRVLSQYLWDHHIELIHLIEITLTSMIIKMVFNQEYSRESIVLLVVLISTFIILTIYQKKNPLTQEKTH